MSHVDNLNGILNNFNGAMLDSIATMNERMSVAGNHLKECVKARASLTDHTQTDFDYWEPPHPYSQRFDEDVVHGDDGLIHNQTGHVYNDIRMEMEINRGGLETQVAVGVPSSNEHIANLINGAPKQRPRPFIRRAYEESKDDLETILRGGK